MRQVSYSTRDTHKGSRLATALCIVGFQKIAKLINRKPKKERPSTTNAKDFVEH